MTKSLIAMALGTFCLGIAEFIMPGILTFVAQDLNISITDAGHLISAYALGVSFGAPIILLSVEKYQMKNVMMFLGALIIFGNILASFAPNYYTLMVARFISGLPHGAYFGIGTIIATKLAGKSKASTAIAIMVSGMTIANIMGVPLGTYLSNNFSWRTIFLGVGIFALLIIIGIKFFVPNIETIPVNKLSDRLKFLKHGAPWLIVGGTLAGNCGIMCWYSYISPLLLNVSGYTESALSIIMVVAGLGMISGNFISGFICDKHSPGLVASLTQASVAIFLLIIFLFAQNSVLSVVMMFLCTYCLFALSSPQQLLIIEYSKGGEKIGGALIQVAFNVGNAIGAFVGGLPLLAGYGYKSSALTGIPFELIGFGLLLFFHRKYENNKEIKY
ncbi:MAG: MFS transporter [Bacteroidales bacterium]|nr:MFS transporter [Bacteroidales bacterium]